jgi:paraquat-inducible protein B
VLYFDEPVEGVQRGAPVMLLGVRAGEVKDVSLSNDRRSGRLRARVEVTLTPARAIGEADDAKASDGSALLEAMVARRGLRAQLRTANLLTGQRYVAFDFFPRVAAARVDRAPAIPVLPTVPSMLPTFEAKVERLLEKLDALPLADAFSEARGVMREAKGAFAGVGTLANDVDRDALPEFVATMQEARSALESAQRMMDGATTTLVGPDAPGQRDLRAALEEIARAAQAMRSLAVSIERHPASLVWGRWGREETGEP